MLAMADRKGRVWASVPGLANRARVDLEDARKAISTLLAPDPDSRTPDFEGRRIEPIDGGWLLLNYAKYREMRDDAERAEQNRQAQARYRSKRDPLTISHDKPQSAQAEAEAYKSKTQVAPLALPEWLDAKQWAAYVETRPARARKPATLQAALAKLAKFRAAGHDPNEIVATSLANGWQGLFEPKGGNGKDRSPPWWSSDATIEAKGASLGLTARRGETMQQFKGRIEVALQGGKP